MAIMFIGHVDCGKSTISGQILYSIGAIDRRDIEKYKKEAQKNGRDSWYLAYIMDQTEEEKEKGKTMETGRACFYTQKRNYTLLDAPGHQIYIQNMITSASQADVGILVISAREGEFEKGFEKGGQTKEHVLLAKVMNVPKLLVLINKMDDKTVQWNEIRYNNICGKLTEFLKNNGFKNIIYIPVSGLCGDNIIKKGNCEWYKGKTFIEELDDIIINDNNNKNLMISVYDKYQDMGKNIIIGKIESGILNKKSKLCIMPNNINIDVTNIDIDFESNDENFYTGDHVYISTKTNLDNINGSVICDVNDPIKPVNKFKAVVQITSVKKESPLITKGTTLMMHLNTLTVEVEIDNVICRIDKKEKKNIETKCNFLKINNVGNVIIKTIYPICCAKYENYKHLGSFTLRSDSQTIAVGKIIGLPNI